MIGPINTLVSAFESRGLPIFFTRDWHPADHVSFTPRGGQWPSHCVQGTPGAEFPESLSVPKGATIISKAMDSEVEAYSGFQNTDLADRLRKLNVDMLYVTGLAADYCVKNTVIDGITAGFEVEVVRDCIKGVNIRRTDSAEAVKAMIRKGAKETTSMRALGVINRRVAI